MKRKYEIQIANHWSRVDSGSALILTVVLTSLLAVIGVMFMMVARVDKISTSAIIENKELNLAVDSVIAKISEQLILDTPGIVDPNQLVREYYDYPDSANPWLASLEPYEVAPGNYRWRHISDVYDVIEPTTGFKTGLLESWGSLGLLDAYDRPVGPYNLAASHVSSSDEITGAYDPANTVSPVVFGGPADADGDGVADSRWIQLPDATGSKGEPIFAAVRIIDNSAMLNVNTAYKFDPGDSNLPVTDLDGSSQTQINLAELSIRGSSNGTFTAAADNLQFARCSMEPTDILAYRQNVVWQYYKPNGRYTPFDISEELELRNRFLINLPDIDTRIEEVWENAFQVGLRTPVDSNSDLPDWFWRVNNSSGDPNYYDYRHIGTIYNTDRIIDPNGRKMLNVNTADAYDIYNTLLTIRNADPNNFLITDAEAAQIAVNIKDYIDGDDPNLPPTLYDPNNAVSYYTTPSGGTYYGFERPCIYISELVHWFNPTPIPGITNKSYAIELYKPYAADTDPNGWQIVIDGNPPISIIWPANRQFCILRNENPDAQFETDDLIEIDPSLVQECPGLVFDAGSNIKLQRFVQGFGYVTVDNIIVPALEPVSGWLREDSSARSFQRDITLHKCIRRLWDINFSQVYPPTFGGTNTYIDPDSYLIQARPANTAFTNIGEMGMVLRRDPNSIRRTDTEASVRIDLANSVFQQLFKYLTVFDPSSDLIDNDNDGLFNEINPNQTPEFKVPGRININTAPWYVIVQLPWVSDHLAQTIVAYRDKLDLTAIGRGDYTRRDGLPGLETIGQLNNVVDPNMYCSIDYYARDANDLSGYPDLTWDDGVGYDFEERDVIFSRISNLVTVRSDVFTGYILVRIGINGPQKRVIAILDRSDVYYDQDKRRISGKVKIVALHPVPDPR